MKRELIAEELVRLAVCSCTPSTPSTPSPPCTPLPPVPQVPQVPPEHPVLQVPLVPPKGDPHSGSPSCTHLRDSVTTAGAGTKQGQPPTAPRGPIDHSHTNDQSWEGCEWGLGLDTRGPINRCADVMLNKKPCPSTPPRQRSSPMLRTVPLSKALRRELESAHPVQKYVPPLVGSRMWVQSPRYHRPPHSGPLGVLLGWISLLLLVWGL